MSKLKVKVLWGEIKRLTSRNKSLETLVTEKDETIERLSDRCTGYANVLWKMINEVQRLRNDCENDWNDESIRGTLDTFEVYQRLDCIMQEGSDSGMDVTKRTT